MSTAVTSKGQVIIPNRVRDPLGIEPGSLIDFQRSPDGRVSRPRSRTRPARTVSRGCGAMPTRAWARPRSWPWRGASADVILVDTNVLLDLVTDDPDWSE